MSGPGSGRYTTYVPVSSAKNTLLNKLFNEKAANGKGIFYGTTSNVVSNTDAAKEAVSKATAIVTSGVGGLLPSDGKQAGDLGMFPNGVDLTYQGTTLTTVPNLNDVKWTKAGDPAIPYAPDVSSPGPGRTEGIDKDVNPDLKVSDFKQNYVPAAPGTGTVSPSTTSEKVSNVLGKDLTPGKSSI